MDGQVAKLAASEVFFVDMQLIVPQGEYQEAIQTTLNGQW